MDLYQQFNNNNNYLLAFSRTTWISQYHYSGFIEARDDAVAVASSGPKASNLHLAPVI